MRVYQRIALLHKSARAILEEDPMKAWEFLESIGLIVSSHLPKGAKFLPQYSSESRMVFQLDIYHKSKLLMDTGWTYHKIAVVPTWTGFELVVSGRDQNGILEKIREGFFNSLDEEYAHVPNREHATA